MAGTNAEKFHKYKEVDSLGRPAGKRSKIDTYGTWKRDGILNDKLLLMEGYARDGARESDIADAFGISHNTLINMKKAHGDVAEALRKGKEIVDYAVENALLRKALSGDVTAMTFWLKNRKPGQWRDLKEVNANLQDGFVNIDLSGIVGSINDKGNLETNNER